VKVLVVGGGAREHALAWKLLRDDRSVEIVAAPGNPGIAELGRCEPVAATDVAGLAALATREGVGLTIVGPEAPLEAGIVDHFRSLGLAAFGPAKAAARIETSKSWAKELMMRAGVPTASAQFFSRTADARAEARRLGVPVVIKATGLAAGKGVVVAQTMAEADAAIAMMLDDRAFGDAGAEVLVEEFMAGEELSIFAVCDGTHALPMIAAQDHKRVGEGDTGPNTGGMGAYAPVSIASQAIADEALDRVVLPTLAAMQKQGAPFTGLLYAGLMLTNDGLKVVEFNCRFGDPETEAVLPLLDSSLLDVLAAVAKGDSLRGEKPLAWRRGSAVTTVVAAQGYPGTVRSGDAMTLPPARDNVHVFHAGTKRVDGRLVSAGGRVLAVTAVAPSLAAAQKLSADAAAGVKLEGSHFRRDIGWRDLKRS
jgi:phosphoribosylamine--glycine ligase